MKVTLINYTQDAMETLIFTKQTRLNMTAGAFDDIKSWSLGKKLAELDYMANTIPSSWEFVDFVFMVEGVSRAYTHQQVRTRAASYAQQTMRVLDMSGFDYITGPTVACDDNVVYLIDGYEPSEEQVRARIYESCMEDIADAYAKLIALGAAPEDARGILPTNIATNIVCKFNLRTLAELARSRTGGRTQGEYQQVINAMIDAVLDVCPWVEKFLFKKDRDYFNEIEEFAKREFPDLLKRGELLKIVDKMRKE